MNLQYYLLKTYVVESPTPHTATFRIIESGVSIFTVFFNSIHLINLQLITCNIKFMI